MYAVVNPATDEPGKSYPTITAEQLSAAVQQADDTYRDWAGAPSVADRAALLRRVGELHTERREQLADLLVTEMGKPRDQALGEIDFCADIYAYYASHAPAMLADQPIDLADGAGSALLRRSPVGVLLGVMPWNFPYYQVSRFAGPNLAAGNTVLLKPAPQCPQSALALGEIYRDAGFPDGAYTVVMADNDQVQDLIADPRIQGISVTGSERAGAAVAEAAGRHLKKVVLELGGSDPFLLLSTNDLDATVEAAVAARLENGGQACNAAKRFIVMDDLFEAFTDRLTARLTAITAGDPTAEGTEVGPLSSTAAADRVENQLQRAVAQGAKLAGGERRGNYVSPGVLTAVKPGDDLSAEELFGPVAVVYRVSSEAEAVSVANASPYGLGSYVFTTDEEQALRVADRIEAGMVWINIVGGDAPELPFGGVKRSGFGRELGTLGIDEFVNKKMIRIAPAAP
ncbi:NAD-dependent succinate-semialdehyde dehydrogenase [Saccharopolyspora phatthalungensis]|uniref:Succinate-semialdehyde dehydrogenase/glutarate-semialdehyde dehydrogenase n=1 Tax=Saccharopolyspora phatthalungensis TaxID=664693 RepID=A0A840Q4N3_9PSEU|nr:NAD-dependent succinate-semialdehyde dehydrogenase [Saccharopolyspora phatthalungensis]MBB5153659.1 succinate-semialdehyde dehydrogenase/glutarate-semialdehyde dehydrogenase [Saccharopolyspora phatthalungensis]